MGKASLVLLAAMAGAAWPTSIMAQAAASPETATPNADIVVTAQRRSQSVKEVPIAITANSGAALTRAGIRDLQDLQILTPGLSAAGEGANAQPAIRGIHSSQTDPGNDPNVATYVDGVYQSNQVANNMALPDVDRVEVLKGPQGTLFGRNATGGAIRVFTRGPSFSSSGFVDASYGNLNDVSASGFVTGPLVRDLVAASLSASYNRSDNFNTNILTDKKGPSERSLNLRGKLLFTPTSNLKITLLGAYSYTFNPTLVEYEPLNGNTIANPALNSGFPAAIYPNAPHQFAPNTGTDGDVLRGKTWTESGTIEWQAGIGTLTSTTSHILTRSFYDNDADFSAGLYQQYPIYEREDDFSQELIFSSKRFGILQLTAGAFYYHANGSYDPLVFQGYIPSAGVGYTVYGFQRQVSNAYAGFGELTLTPIDRLNIILGARYSYEQRSGFSNFYAATTPVPPDTLTSLGKVSFNAFTPRASIRYTFDSGDNVYFTYSKGFKSGGINISGTSPPFTFKPEKVDSFEIGLKTSTRRAISFNASAFYYNYKDQQVVTIDAVSGTGITNNAASSHIYGMDADFIIRPARDFSFSGGLAWLHARFASYPNAAVTSPVFAAPGCGCVNGTGTMNLSGYTEPFAPAFTFNGTAQYGHDFRAGRFDLSTTVYFSGKYYRDVADRVSQSRYATLSARASFRPAGTGITLYAYGRNITNTRYWQTLYIGGDGDGVSWAAPATYGAGARFDF